MDLNYDWLSIIQTILLLLILIELVKQNRKKTKTTRFKVLFRRTVIIAIHACSKLFPKNKKIVVFGGENGNGFRGNPKYLFLELNKNPKLRCVWITKNWTVKNELSRQNFEVHMYNSLKGVYFQLRGKLMVHSHAINDDFNNKYLGGAISYNTWHGVGLKKVWGANSNTFSYKVLHEKNVLKRYFGMLVVKTNQAKKNYVVSTSEKVTSYYPETFLTSPKNILELGQVRNDIFFEDSEEDNQVPEWYKNGKVILYMPTHRKKGKKEINISSVFEFELLDEMCEILGCKFVVKRHMYSVGKIPTHFNNIIDISSEDIDPQFLLKYADVMVTDYSSAYTDYLLLDRPVLFYSYDLESYLNTSNEMYHNYFDVTPGPKIQYFYPLLNEIRKAIDQPSLFAEERKRVLDIFYSEENQQPVLHKQVHYITDEILKIS